MPHKSWGSPGLSRTAKILVPGGGIQLNVHPELEVIFGHLVSRLHDVRMRHGKGPLTSSGGYNKRKISGSNTWSNHSWGLAADFNAATNPYSHIGRTDFPADETRQIAKELGFRWGWDYAGKKDAMHFEYMGSIDDARALTARLRGAAYPDPQPVPASPVPAAPLPTPQPAPVRPAPGPRLAADGQLWLNPDGDLGPKTIARWQQIMGTPIDGVISRPSELVKAVQRRLGFTGRDVDGVGIRQENGYRTNTIRRLQSHLGVHVDGELSSPESNAVKALQDRLNQAKF